MKKVISFFFLVIIVFTACNKDSGSALQKNDLLGDWSFDSLSAQTQSTSTYDFFGTEEKGVTFSNYTSTNNTGTVTFNDSIVTAVGLSYEVSTSVKTYSYENGVLTDSAELPFTYTLPATNSAAAYELIGSDSIYFPNGSFVSTAGSGTTTSEASGGRININGNMLTLTQFINQDTTEVIGSSSIHIVQTGKASIFLGRK